MNTCHGDSGGPLVCVKGTQPVLYGVTSWGDPECSHFSVFTKVSNYIDWIQTTTRNEIP